MKKLLDSFKSGGSDALVLNIEVLNDGTTGVLNESVKMKTLYHNITTCLVVIYSVEPILSRRGRWLQEEWPSLKVIDVLHLMVMVIGLYTFINPQVH